MAFDETVPKSLRETQQWFGSIIEQPLQNEGRIQPITPRNNPISAEAALFITPSEALEPWERIEIYNQQYWYRLIDCLQEIYPLVVHLLGIETFNKEIAVPYLCARRPISWSLNDLGDQLPAWIPSGFQGDQKELICQAAHCDWACHASFLAGEYPSIQTQLQGHEDFQEVIERPMRVQPHLFVLEGCFDLLAVRKAVIRGEQPSQRPAPLSEQTFWLVYRKANQVTWKELTSGEAELLTSVQLGMSIAKACALLEAKEPALLEKDSERVAYWIQEWVLRGWLSLSN